MFRTKLLSAGKLAALGLFVSIAVALVVYLKVRDNRPHADQSTPKLQGRVVAVFNNTRYAHEVEGQVRFLLTAGVDKTYEDGTHELEQVRLESHGTAGTRKDIVTADRAKVSDPADLNKLDAEFISNVVVETTEEMIIKTAYLHYDQQKNTVDSNELVEFEGPKLAGRSTGMLIEATDERIHLLKDVDLTIKPEKDGDGKPRAAGNKGDKAEKKRNETPEEKAARKARKRARKLAKQSKNKESAAKKSKNQTQNQKTQNSKLKTQNSKLKTQNSKLKTQNSTAGPSAPKKPTHIRCQTALLEKKEHRATFDTNVIVDQGTDEMRADHMVSYLDDANKIERIEARTNSYLKQEDKAEIKSTDMDFFFGDDHQLSRAVATGNAYARSLGPDPLREARAQNIEAKFAEGEQGNGIDTLVGQGGASVYVHAPPPTNDRDNPANRELMADNVTLQFYPDGRNIQTAVAHDNAVMIVTPVRAVAGADKKTIHAPSMTGDFYEEGGRLKTFNATGGVKVEVESLVANTHPPRVTTSRELTANFLPDSQDLSQISQEGDFKYNEGDRNALADRAVYDDQKEFLELRGKRPVAWDAKARTQADEIDYDRAKDETHGRGDVRTTYYNREATNDATPFSNSKSPVFITAERADLRNQDGIAVYTINARAWQDDNFVKADRIELYQEEKKMIATGNVDSALYKVNREAEPGKHEVVPGFASAERMTYSDKERLVHYDGKVKARQGTDRIDAASIDSYLKQETNEIDHLIATGDVVMTQPGRRGTGDKLNYTADDGRAVLTGKNARVDSDEQGTTIGAQLTLYSHDDKIFVENQGTGRVRSTHRLAKEQRE